MKTSGKIARSLCSRALVSGGLALSLWACQFASTTRTFEESWEIGNTKIARGDYKGAQQEFESALRKDPNNPNLLMLRGLAQAEQGKLILAIEDYSQALLEKPDLYQALVHRGNAYNQLLQLDKALFDFSQAIVIQPENAVALSNRAMTYYNLGQRKEAIADLEQAKALLEKEKATVNVAKVEQLLKEYQAD
ncbi:MAG: tetratricopeptide repeat protein [Acaryochloridaceae cyanobacterium RL_2_7]|nr:tetratricopeptide repeat protein [Acaryochloridaceae cyanobacterium RL_2_7]